MYVGEIRGCSPRYPNRLRIEKMGSPFTTFEGLPGKGVVSPWNEGFSFIFELSSENLGESKEYGDGKTWNLGCTGDQ